MSLINEPNMDSIKTADASNFLQYEVRSSAMYVNYTVCTSVDKAEFNVIELPHNVLIDKGLARLADTRPPYYR